MLITNLNTHAASYVSVAELAEYWDVTRQLVYKHVQSGQLPAIQLGPRCFRIHTKDAVAFERLISSKWRKNSSSTGPDKVRRAPIASVPNRRRQARGDRSLFASNRNSDAPPAAPNDLARQTRREPLTIAQPIQPGSGTAARLPPESLAASFLEANVESLLEADVESLVAPKPLRQARGSRATGRRVRS